jgi:acyl dehydratase
MGSVVSEKYLEDLHVGDRFGSDTIEATEESIIAFAREFDPQQFHLDAKAAEQSIFKGLSASGWHTAAMSMKLFVTGELKLAGGSVGLGVDELRWPLPVRPGDVLRLETEILDVRTSKSKPDRGIIRIRNVTTNQRGEVVQTFMAFVMVRRRL